MCSCAATPSPARRSACSRRPSIPAASSSASTSAALFPEAQMNNLSAEKRSELLASTHDAAKELLHDLPHFWDIAARRETSYGDLRRLSADARRLLVERDIAHIAVPRIGKLELSAPDYRTVYDVAKRVQHVKFFGGAYVCVFGVEFGPTFLFNSGTPAFGVSAKDHMAKIMQGQSLYKADRITHIRPLFGPACSLLRWILGYSAGRYQAYSLLGLRCSLIRKASNGNRRGPREDTENVQVRTYAGWHADETILRRRTLGT